MLLLQIVPSLETHLAHLKKKRRKLNMIIKGKKSTPLKRALFYVQNAKISVYEKVCIVSTFFLRVFCVVLNYQGAKIVPLQQTCNDVNTYIPGKGYPGIWTSISVTAYDAVLHSECNGITSRVIAIL